VSLCLSVEEVREVHLLLTVEVLANTLGMELEDFRLAMREMEVEMVAGEAMRLTIILEEQEAEQEDTGEQQQQYDHLLLTRASSMRTAMPTFTAFLFLL
jgi:hypothetical protein